LTSDQPSQISVAIIPLIALSPKENLQMTTATQPSARPAQFTAFDKELDNVIDTALALNRIVATVILVAHRGQIVYQRAAGFADREERRLARPDTIFRFASLAKPILSVAALALVEQGKLKLNDPVSKWIPEFRPRLSDGREPIITIRHPQRLGWGFGFGAAILKDPVAAQTPQSKGTFAWGGVYGHSWFVDPHLELSVVGLTNTALEGMAGLFTVAVRDAVYRGITE
jgi:CubicO group peptidase (beta-lactamase class C family)